MNNILRNNYFILLLFLALSFILYGNSINGEFVLDDISVVQSPIIDTAGGLLKAFVSPYYYARPQSGLYRPATLVSFQINKYFSNKPFGFHFSNIVLHGIVCFLIFLFILYIRNRQTAYIGATLFMFLPIHVESISSIVGRAELLSLLFLVSALLLVLKNKYWQSSISFALALFSKEIGIAFIPIWVYVELAQKKTSIKVLFRKSLLFIPSIITYSFLRYLALGSDYFVNAGGYSFFNPIRSAKFWPGIWTALKVLTLYCSKIIFPTYFSSDYSYNQIPIVSNVFGSWLTLFGIVIIAGLIYFAIRSRNHMAGLGCVVFLSSYFVISNLIFKTGTIMAERLMYMPSLGFALIAADLFSSGFQAKKYKNILMIVLIILLTIYGARTIKGSSLWQNEKTLFENAYKYAPDSVVNMTNTASILFRDGKSKEAIEKLDKALAMEPNNGPALHIYGQIEMLLNHPDKAEKLWYMAISAQPDYLYPYLSLGTFYYNNGRFHESENILIQSPVSQPLMSIMVLRSLDKIGLGQFEEAINLIEGSFGKEPEAGELQFVLGIAYLKLGQDKVAGSFLLKFKNPELTDEQYFKSLKETKVFNIEI